MAWACSEHAAAAAWRNWGSPIDGFFPKTFLPSQSAAPRDVEAAKELIADSSCADGCELSIMAVDETSQQVAAAIQQYVEEIGVTIKVEVRGDGHGNFTFGIPLYIGASGATTNAKPVEAKEVQFLKAIQALWGSPTCVEVEIEKKDREK